MCFKWPKELAEPGELPARNRINKHHKTLHVFMKPTRRHHFLALITPHWDKVTPKQLLPPSGLVYIQGGCIGRRYTLEETAFRAQANIISGFSRGFKAPTLL